MVEPVALDPALAALVDYLRLDQKPTAIRYQAPSDKATKGSLDQQEQYIVGQYVFRNQAFIDLLAADPGIAFALASWALDNKTNVAESSISGRQFTLRTVAERWEVVSCQNGAGEQPPRSPLPLSRESSSETPSSMSEEAVSAADDTCGERTRSPSTASLPGFQDSTAVTEEYQAIDWKSTALGPMSSWSRELTKLFNSMLRNPAPRLIFWGPSKICLYNKAAQPLLGEAHPSALGTPYKQVFSRITNQSEPVLNAGYEGQTLVIKDFPSATLRSGEWQETYFDFCIFPCESYTGKVLGVLVELTETTSLYYSRHRSATLNRIEDALRPLNSLEDLWKVFLGALASSKDDIPFAAFYRAIPSNKDDNSAGETRPGSGRSSVKSSTHECDLFVLEASVGFADGSAALPSEVRSTPTSESAEASADHLTVALETAINKRVMTDLNSAKGTLPVTFQSVAGEQSPTDPVKVVKVIPIASNDVLGALVLAIHPRRPFTEDSAGYFQAISALLTKYTQILSLPEEQRANDAHIDHLNFQIDALTREAEKIEAKFARMAAHSPNGMFVLNSEDKFAYVNDAYLKLIGVSREEFNLRSEVDYWTQLVHPEDVELSRVALRQIKEHKQPHVIEARMKDPWVSIDKSTGQEITSDTWVRTTTVPEINENGCIIAIQGWVENISHQKFSEYLVARKLHEALEAKRQSENFIDMTSHEMRNPLSAILQSADTVVSTLRTLSGRSSNGDDVWISSNDANDMLDAAQTIVLCAQHQRRIVDDILTVSKLDSSLLELSPDNAQPIEILRKALIMYEAEINNAKIEATLEVEQSYVDMELDWLVFDQSRFLQVVINLLTNAIKFTKHAKKRCIRLTLAASAEQPISPYHGINFLPTHARGRRPSLAPSVDGSDSQGHVYLSMSVIDTGKGLTAEEMQLLFQRFSQASPKTHIHYGGSGLGLFISKELCELQGGQIGASSANGETTFGFYVTARRPPARESKQSTDSTGFAAKPNPASRPPFSRAQTRESNIENSAETNAVGAMASLILPNTPPQTPLEAPEIFDTHVLVVEDNLINQKVMTAQLRRAGCIPHVANHGVECLEYVERSALSKPGGTSLSIILLDIEMPIMDGLTCIRHIRERQKSGQISRHVPVIAVTANARGEQIALALEAGVDDIITKPFRLAELLPKMTRLLSGQQASGL